MEDVVTSYTDLTGKPKFTTMGSGLSSEKVVIQNNVRNGNLGN
jgi:hypothetical protein